MQLFSAITDLFLTNNWKRKNLSKLGTVWKKIYILFYFAGYRYVNKLHH